MAAETRTPLDDVALLARSQHRATVLRVLMAGPTTRRAIHEETSISQPTLGRILGTFEDRNWVRRADGDYQLTPWGDLIATAFDDLLETVESVHRLADVADLLPAEELDFDVRRLASARVTTPRPGDSFCHIRRAKALLRSAPSLRIVTEEILGDALEDQHTRIVDGDDPDYCLEAVVTRDALEQAVSDETLVNWIRDLLESDHTSITCYDGAVPMTMAVIDETALLVPADAQGIPGALIESEDAAVRSWVDEQFETYRRAATPLTPSALPD